MIYEISNGRMRSVRALFEGWDETMIWSCLQGVMGHIYADSDRNPTAAMAILGDFCFFAGTPSEELLSYKPEWCQQDFIIMVPQNQGWAGLLETVYGAKAARVTRYAIKKKPGCFDVDYLAQLVEAVPQEYVFQMIDTKSLYERCKDHSWSMDFVSQYKDFEEYQRLGLGVVILTDGQIVSGASSYSSYQGGIEIEIDTKKGYRRRGLALACGARLILECLYRGLYPSWDAQNEASAALAQQLGYHYDHKYTAYEIRGY